MLQCMEDACEYARLRDKLRIVRLNGRYPRLISRSTFADLFIPPQPESDRGFQEPPPIFSSPDSEGRDLVQCYCWATRTYVEDAAEARHPAGGHGRNLVLHLEHIPHVEQLWTPFTVPCFSERSSGKLRMSWFVVPTGGWNSGTPRPMRSKLSAVCIHRSSLSKFGEILLFVHWLAGPVDILYKFVSEV